MSWFVSFWVWKDAEVCRHGFVKAVNRATTSVIVPFTWSVANMQVMMSTGAIEKTVDKEYEKQEGRFNE